MRTAREEAALYTALTPAEFGRRIGGEKPVSASQVRRQIAAGLIRPEFVTVVNPGSRRPEYRIDPAAVGAFRDDHRPKARAA